MVECPVCGAESPETARVCVACGVALTDENAAAQTSDNEATLDRLTRTIPPMDVAVAEELLREAKQILDRLGVTFFLRQGTCLGAFRDHAFIPWDDDLDLGIVIGLHGFTEQSIEPVLAAFRDSGYYVKAERADSIVLSTLLKRNMRIDLLFHWVIGEQICHWPGIWFPVRLFNQLKEIEFIGETFLVPNPPEEYLRIKYGPDWLTPKRIGYEQDVVDNIQEGPAPRHLARLRRFLAGRLFPWRVARLRVLDHRGRPVPGAEVRIVGLGRFRTDKRGYAKLYLHSDSYSSAMPSVSMYDDGGTYAIVVSYDDHEEVLYEEVLAPRGSYLYRPDPAFPAGRIFILSQQ